MFCIKKKKKHCTLQACIREYEASYRQLLVSVTASQGQDKSGRFPVLSCVSSFFFSLFPSAADGKEEITFCLGQDASGSGFKLWGPLWTWLIGQDYFAYAESNQIYAREGGGICKAAWYKDTDKIRDFTEQQAWATPSSLTEQTQTNSDRGMLLATLTWREVEEM